MTHIENLEGLLNSDDTNSSIIDLDNFIGELCDYGDNMDVLSEPQKNFYLNQNLEREINNGGFNQYFINPSGDYAHETIHSLKLIGANRTNEILEKAIDQFPDKIVPKDRDERVEIVEEIEETANEVWEELDQKFFEYVDDLNALNIEYVRQNKEHF
jgi:hypothetical protein